MGKRRRRRRGSGGVSRRKVLGGLGVGLAAIGGGSLAVGTRAYDSVEADRTTNVSTADDPSALLGLEGNDDTSVTPTVTNNTNNSMDVTFDSSESVEFDVGTNGTYEAVPVTFSLASGETKEVAISYTGDCTDAGSATIDKTVDLLDGGSTVGSITLSRTWQIPESGQIQVTANVKSAGNSGKYEFELENTGCFDVTITGLGINETTNTDATKVGGKNNDDILTQGGTAIVSSVIPIDNSDPDNATIVDFDTNVPLAQNETKTFTFDRFRDDANNNVKMKGDDVKTTLQFSDGSTAVTKLCLNGCSF